MKTKANANANADADVDANTDTHADVDANADALQVNPVSMDRWIYYMGRQMLRVRTPHVQNSQCSELPMFRYSHVRESPDRVGKLRRSPAYAELYLNQ